MMWNVFVVEFLVWMPWTLQMYSGVSLLSLMIFVLKQTYGKSSVIDMNYNPFLHVQWGVSFVILWALTRFLYSLWLWPVTSRKREATQCSKPSVVTPNHINYIYSLCLLEKAGFSSHVPRQNLPHCRVFISSPEFCIKSENSPGWKAPQKIIWSNLSFLWFIQVFVSLFFPYSLPLSGNFLKIFQTLIHVTKEKSIFHTSFEGSLKQWFLRILC